MRQSQKNNRPRSRGRKPSNPLSRSYDSNGPDVKIRGTASHIAEKYQSLARDALASGDIVMAENYYQHAEHYLRIIAAAQPAPRENDNRSAKDNQDNADNGKAADKAATAASGSDNETGPQPVVADGGSTASEMDVVAPEGVASQNVEGANGSVDPATQEQPAPRRRRRTTYRSRKRSNPEAGTNAAPAEDAPAVPVSMPDAPQPVISDD